MRNRMRSFSSSGSTWMSLARSRIAWLTMRFTNWTIGRLVVEVDLVGLVGAFDLAVGRLERRDEASDVGIRTPDLLDDRLDRLGVGGQPLEFLAGGGLGSVAARFGRIGREDDEFAVLLRDRDKEEGAGEALVDPLGELGVDLGGAGVAERDAARRRQRTRILGPTNAMPGEQQLPEFGEVAVRFLKRRREPLTVEVAGLHQALTQRDALLDAGAQ